MSDITISKDKNDLNLFFIYNFLTNSYWAKGRSMEQVKASIENSICYGIYKGEKQIGFARVISDTIVFAYIMDVFIIESERGNSYASKLMKHMLNDQSLVQVSQWHLKTKDAHQFYKIFGFNQLQNQEWFMERMIS
jgi:N-acetylglutamate synthase-like GNAT family acetyltransferase